MNILTTLAGGGLEQRPIIVENPSNLTELIIGAVVAIAVPVLVAAVTVWIKKRKKCNHEE
jgi:hypothetical protein